MRRAAARRPRTHARSLPRERRFHRRVSGARGRARLRAARREFRRSGDAQGGRATHEAGRVRADAELADGDRRQRAAGPGRAPAARRRRQGGPDTGRLAPAAVGGAAGQARGLFPHGGSGRHHGPKPRGRARALGRDGRSARLPRRAPVPRGRNGGGARAVPPPAGSGGALAGRAGRRSRVDSEGPRGVCRAGAAESCWGVRALAALATAAAAASEGSRNACGTDGPRGLRTRAAHAAEGSDGSRGDRSRAARD
mmetsp:Transcript_29181/g.87247  ORF Transcript_29181/g.87247 Transcript_29181/m.87247 type:complete len:254 (+) Transcript_29181:355-1116(+)